MFCTRARSTAHVNHRRSPPSRRHRTPLPRGAVGPRRQGDCTRAPLGRRVGIPTRSPQCATSGAHPVGSGGTGLHHALRRQCRAARRSRCRQSGPGAPVRRAHRLPAALPGRRHGPGEQGRPPGPACGDHHGTSRLPRDRRRSRRRCHRPQPRSRPGPSARRRRPPQRQPPGRGRPGGQGGLPAPGRGLPPRDPRGRGLRLRQGLGRHRPAQPLGLRRGRRPRRGGAVAPVPPGPRPRYLHQPRHGGLQGSRPDHRGVHRHPRSGGPGRLRGRYRAAGLPARFSGRHGAPPGLGGRPGGCRRGAYQGARGQGRQPVHGAGRCRPPRLGATSDSSLWP